MTSLKLSQETYEIGGIITRILPWGNHSTERFPNLPEVTEAISSTAGIQI